MNIPAVNSRTCNSIFAKMLCITIFISCSNRQQEAEKKLPAEQQKELNVKKVISKPPSSYPDTLIISAAAAVFYNPDSLQAEKIRAITPETSFRSMTHENFYQMRNAKLVLKRDWPKIKIIETSNARYLLFIDASNDKTCIDLDKHDDMSGLFLFDPAKKPQVADMTNIDTELWRYFTK